MLGLFAIFTRSLAWWQQAGIIGISAIVLIALSILIYVGVKSRPGAVRLPPPAAYVALNAPDVMLNDVRHRDVVLFNQYHFLFTARFFNNASRSGACARTVVARMTYYKEASQQPLIVGQSFRCVPDLFAPDPLWKCTNGLWLPGKLGQVDFAPNAAHELALVVIVPEEQPTVHAIAYRKQERPDIDPIDLYCVHRELPVLVDVELRALDIASRRFRFRVYMRNGELTCDQCPTPT